MANSTTRKNSMNDIQRWFDEKLKLTNYSISEIPFELMDKWYFDNIDTNLRHQKGTFYSIEGIRVTTNYGETQTCLKWIFFW